MKFFLVFFIFIKILFANNLQNLLDKYELVSLNESALKTKKESLGHLITFTQQDIKMMQAKVLKDILKTLQNVSLQINFLGSTNLTYAGIRNSISTSMRLYIDNKELSSVQTLSPWALFSDYPLDHVSHIEIYYGESTFLLGNEPAQLTVKMYTKKPYTVSGSILRNTFSTSNSYSNTIVYAQDYKKSSLLFMLNSIKNNNPSYILNNGILKNDSQNEYGYFKYRQNEYKVSGGFTQLKKDNFQSLAYDSIPNFSKTKQKEFFIEFSKSFNESRGNIYANYNQSNKEINNKNNEGILLIPLIDFANFNSSTPKEINENITLKKYDFGISNIFEFNNSSLFLAGTLKHKKYKVNSRDILTLDNTRKNNVDYISLKNEDIYSLMSEYSYYLNDSNILITNLKYDKYKKSKNFSSFDYLTTRLGYISALNNNLNLKIFTTKTFTPPSMFETDFAVKNDKDLEKEDKNINSFEINYKDEKQNISLYLNYLKIKNSIFLDFNKIGYINYNRNLKVKGFAFTYERYLNEYNRFDVNYYSYTNSMNNYQTPKSGGVIKIYQKIGDLSFYEELIYKQKYKFNNKLKVKDSYNLSLGFNYRISKDIDFDFKANNLLNDDMDLVFTNYKNMTYFKLPNSKRNYTASIRWNF